MEFLSNLYNQLMPLIDWLLIIGILAIGELTKKFWKGDSVGTSWKVLLTTSTLALAYVIFMHKSAIGSLISFLLATWLYDIMVKHIMRFLTPKPSRPTKPNKDFVGDRPDDRG